MGFQLASGRNVAHLLSRSGSHLTLDGAFENRLPDEERRLVAEPDRDGIAGTSVDLHDSPLGIDDDQRVVDLLGETGYHDALDPAFELVDQTLGQIMGVGPRLPLVLED